MDETSIVAGPPKAELCPVKSFLPGVNLDDDERFKALAGPLDEADVEFAKAMALCQGNKARAAAMIFPDMGETAQRKWGSRHGKEPAVVALINYLQSLDYTDDRPVTIDELRKEINKRWRSNPKDNAAFMELTKTMCQLNGIKMGEQAPRGEEQRELALERANEILAEMRAVGGVQ